MRVLGIDPGSSVTGFGIVERADGRVVHVGHGTIRPPRKDPLERRLAFIHEHLSEMISVYEPEVAVIERVFISSNPRSALVLGHARGVALAAASSAGLSVAELAPRAVKKAVVGTGNATKQQVQEMVRRLLALESVPPQDAADALAIAIGHAHAGRLADLDFSGSRGRRRPSRRKSASFVLGRAR